MDYEAAPIIPLLRAPSFSISSRRDMWLLRYCTWNIMMQPMTPAPETIDPSPDDPEAVIRIDRPIKWMRRFCVVWFFGYHVVLIGSLTVLSGGNPSFDFPHFGLILLFIVISGNLLWLYAGWNIYDTLFTMAEGRWPIAGELRRIVSPLVRILISHHH
jgi:hypothetical protein